MDEVKESQLTLEQTFHLEPNNKKGQQLQGKIYWAQQKYDLYASHIKTHPEEVNAVYNKAEFLYRKKHDVVALKVVNAIIVV